MPDFTRGYWFGRSGKPILLEEYKDKIQALMLEQKTVKASGEHASVFMTRAPPKVVGHDSQVKMRSAKGFLTSGIFFFFFFLFLRSAGPGPTQFSLMSWVFWRLQVPVPHALRSLHQREMLGSSLLGLCVCGISGWNFAGSCLFLS